MEKAYLYDECCGLQLYRKGNAFYITDQDGKICADTIYGTREQVITELANRIADLDEGNFMRMYADSEFVTALSYDDTGRAA